MRKFTGIGRLGRDPELKQTRGGTSVSSVSVAFDDGYGDRKSTLWIKLEFWGKQAENFCRFLSKGDQIYAEGRLDIEEWKDRDGKDRFTMKVTGSRFEFFGGKKTDSDSGGYQDDNRSRGGNDDIPF